LQIVYSNWNNNKTQANWNEKFIKIIQIGKLEYKGYIWFGIKASLLERPNKKFRRLKSSSKINLFQTLLFPTTPFYRISTIMQAASRLILFAYFDMIITYCQIVDAKAAIIHPSNRCMCCTKYKTNLQKANINTCFKYI
jgi:hypothetical protein